MGIGVLVIGESGTGKSRSIKTLDPESTFIIKIIDKPLPFRDGRKLYLEKEKLSEGNVYVCRNHGKIINMLKGISEKMPHIKNIVIDDFQYLMSYEFMDRAMEKGFNKFTEIGKHAFDVINTPPLLRSELNVYFLTHCEFIEGGSSRMKTIGKILDEKITVDGIFTLEIHSVFKDKEYKFLTNRDGPYGAKTPEDMFEDLYIDNDLNFVDTKIREYFN